MAILVQTRLESTNICGYRGSVFKENLGEIIFDVVLSSFIIDTGSSSYIKFEPTKKDFKFQIGNADDFQQVLTVSKSLQTIEGETVDL